MPLNLIRYRLDTAIKRAGQAWRLARGRLTTEDARDLYATVTGLAGWRPLESIDDSTVYENLLDEFHDHPNLESYVELACARVADKWSSTGDIRWAAYDWARSLVLEYAMEDGVTLIEHVADEPAEAEAA